MHMKNEDGKVVDHIVEDEKTDRTRGTSRKCRLASSNTQQDRNTRLETQ